MSPGEAAIEAAARFAADLLLSLVDRDAAAKHLDDAAVRRANAAADAAEALKFGGGP